MVTESKERQIDYFMGHSQPPEDLLNLCRIKDGSIVAELANIGRFCANLYIFDNFNYRDKINISRRGTDFSANLAEGTQYALAISMQLSNAEYNRLITPESKTMVKKRPFLGVLARINQIPVAHQIIQDEQTEIIQEKLIEMELIHQPLAICSIFELHRELSDGITNSESLVHLPSNGTPEMLEVVLVKGSENIHYRPKFKPFAKQPHEQDPEIDRLTIDTTPIVAFSIKFLG